MKWNHLPVTGGLYDQDPELLTRFGYIFAQRAEFEEKEARDRERKAGRKSSGGKGRLGRAR